jgi:hypothetical protein
LVQLGTSVDHQRTVHTSIPAVIAGKKYVCDIVVENHDNPDFPMAWEVLRYVWRLGKAK